MINESVIRRLIKEEIVNYLQEETKKKKPGFLTKGLMTLAMLVSPSVHKAFAKDVNPSEIQTLLNSSAKKATDGKEEYAQIYSNFAYQFFKDKLPKDEKLLEIFKKEVLDRFFAICIAKKDKIDMTDKDNLMFLAKGLFETFSKKHETEIKKAASKESSNSEEASQIKSKKRPRTEYREYTTTDLTPSQLKKYKEDSERLKKALDK